jgi:hypothetical protein
MASADKKRESKTGPFPARAALWSGDFKRAHQLAQAVLKNDDAAEAEKQDAREILDATRVDYGQVLAALAVFAILAVLFGWVLTRAHTSF